MPRARSHCCAKVHEKKSILDTCAVRHKRGMSSMLGYSIAWLWVTRDISPNAHYLAQDLCCVCALQSPGVWGIQGIVHCAGDHEMYGHRHAAPAHTPAAHRHPNKHHTTLVSLRLNTPVVQLSRTQPAHLYAQHTPIITVSSIHCQRTPNHDSHALAGAVQPSLTQPLSSPALLPTAPCCVPCQPEHCQRAAHQARWRALGQRTSPQESHPHPRQWQPAGQELLQ